MHTIPTVLVVTSHISFRLAYDILLEDYPSSPLNPIYADDEQETIQLLRDNPETKLILLDMDSLGDCALALLTMIKHLPIIQEIPVVLLVGGDKLVETFRGLEAGAFSVLNKPLTREHLYMRLDLVLGVGGA